MGEAARRKDVIQDVRKKVGAQAAEAVGELRAVVRQLQLQHRALAREILEYRREVDQAVAGRQVDRKHQGALYDKLAEQLENMNARLSQLERPLFTSLEVHGEVSELRRELVERFDRLDRAWWSRLLDKAGL